MSEHSNNQIAIILYSSLLVAIAEILLAKISPQLFSLLAPLPMMMIAAILSLPNYFKSLILSVGFYFGLNKFISFNGTLPQNYLAYFIIITILISLLFFMMKRKKKGTMKLSSVFIVLLLFTFFLSSIFSLYFNSNVNVENLKEFLTNLSSDITGGKIQNKELQSIIELVLLILPSLNTFGLMITLTFNYFFSIEISKKLGLVKSSQFKYHEWSLPRWYTIMFLLFIIATYLNIMNTSFITINLMIVFSFSYFFEGAIIFLKSFNRFELNPSVKFIIIFLLFLFLGYVLLLVIFLIGFYINFKKLIVLKKGN